MTRSILLALSVAALPCAAQSTGGTFSPVSIGPDGAPLLSSANLVEVTDAGVFASGLFLTDGGAFDVSVKRWTGSGWTGVGSITGDTQALEAAPDGTLYAVGPRIGESSNLARWDGQTWHEFGFGTEAAVRDISIAPDGTVAVVALGAWPSEVFTVRIYQDGAWRTLGAPLPEQSTDLVIVSADEVYVSGSTGVQRWDGANWTAVGGTFSGQIRAMRLSDAGLVVGGDFTSVGSVPAAYVALWNGSAWTALGSGLPGPVSSLDVSGAHIAALSQASDTGPTVIGQWSGGGWEIGAVPVNSYVRGVALTGAGEVYLAGAFFTPTFNELSAVHQRTADGWRPLGASVNDTVWSFARGDGGRPVMSGSFGTAGDVSAVRVAQNEPDGWSALGAGLPRMSSSYPVLARGADGRLYAGARFVEPGAGFRTLAAWDGSAWSTLGPADDRVVIALHLGADGHLYASLVFGEPGVYRWTGTAWAQVGASFDLAPVTLATAPDGRLCAGGGFLSVGSAPIEGIACWDGSAWGPLGASLDLPEGFGATVRSIAFGTDGTPYAGGTAVGGDGVAVIYWTGAEWAPVPGAPFREVLAMAIHPSGALYAAGTVSISQASQLLSSWNGDVWQDHGRASGSISALWVDDAGSVWAGGSFNTLGGVHSPNVIRFDPAPPTASQASPRSGSALVHIVPNPARGAARLTATVPAGAAEVSVYDALGRRVAVAFDGETSGSLSVPLGLMGLAPGVYVVRLQTADGTEAVRLTVTR